MSKKQEQERPGFVRVYIAVKGLASRTNRHFCAKCLRTWRADGWKFRAFAWTAEGSPFAVCLGCANPGERDRKAA